MTPEDNPLPELQGLDPNDWLGALDELGEEEGHFEWLGSSHFALFLDRGRSLIVTCETVEGARALPGARPRALAPAAAQDWSVLALFSQGETWFRDPAVWRYLDRLTDDGFFDQYQQILFWGEGSCGYAAAALSVAAPGARVLVLRPQATLDPEFAGWDKRFLRERRRDFTSRYGYAPDMIEAAAQGFVIYDPAVMADAAHAALFRRPNVQLLRCPLTGSRPGAMLDIMGIHDRIIALAMEGALDRESFAREWRARRQSLHYGRGLLKLAERAERPDLVRRICRWGAGTRDAAFYARHMAEQDRPAGAAAE